MKEILGINGDSKKTMNVVKEIIKAVDLNGDGKISYDEFKKMMMQRKA